STRRPPISCSSRQGRVCCPASRKGLPLSRSVRLRRWVWRCWLIRRSRRSTTSASSRRANASKQQTSFGAPAWRPRPLRDRSALRAAGGGRVKAAPVLPAAGPPEVFVGGAAALVPGPDGEPLPGLAPAAKQQGQYVGELISRRVCGEAAPPPFRYRDAGALAT